MLQSWNNDPQAPKWSKLVLENLSEDARRVLHAIYSAQSATRLSILTRTGLSKGRVAAALRALRDQGLVLSREDVPQGQGRPSVIHSISPEAFFAVGAALKIGSCRIAVVSGAGGLLESRDVPTPPGALEERELVDLLAGIQGEIQASISRREQARCVAVGISVLGRVDTERGVWLSGLQYGPFRDVSVGPHFAGLGVSVMIEDHARSAAYAELRRQAHRPPGDFVLLYMGEGLGSALVLGADLYRGSHGVAGDIGHVALEGNDKRCACGDTGCLETVASGAGILSTVRARIAEGVVSTLKARVENGEKLTLASVREAAASHDRLAEQVLLEAGAALGEACSLVMKMVNTPRIIVSGEAAELSDFLQEPMERRIRERAPREALLDFHAGFIRYSEDDEAAGVALLSIDRALSAARRGAPQQARRT